MFLSHKGMHKRSGFFGQKSLGALQYSSPIQTGMEWNKQHAPVCACMRL